MGGKNSGRKKTVQPITVLKKAKKPAVASPPPAPALTQPEFHDPNKKEDIDVEIDKLKNQLREASEAAAPVIEQKIETGPAQKTPEAEPQVISGLAEKCDENGLVIEADFNLEAIKKRAESLKPYAHLGLSQVVNRILVAAYENEKAALPEEIIEKAVPVVANFAAVILKDVVKMTQKQAFYQENIGALYEVAQLHYQSIKDLKPEKTISNAD